MRLDVASAYGKARKGANLRPGAHVPAAALDSGPHVQARQKRGCEYNKGKVGLRCFLSADRVESFVYFVGFTCFRHQSILLLLRTSPSKMKGKKAISSKFPTVSLVYQWTIQRNVDHYRTRQARIKKIMQEDEEIGKVAQGTPIVICMLRIWTIVAKDPTLTALYYIVS